MEKPGEWNLNFDKDDKESARNFLFYCARKIIDCLVPKNSTPKKNTKTKRNLKDEDNEELEDDDDDDDEEDNNNSKSEEEK